MYDHQTLSWLVTKAIRQNKTEEFIQILQDLEPQTQQLLMKHDNYENIVEAVKTENPAMVTAVLSCLQPSEWRAAKLAVFQEKVRDLRSKAQIQAPILEKEVSKVNESQELPTQRTVLAKLIRGQNGYNGLSIDKRATLFGAAMKKITHSDYAAEEAGRFALFRLAISTGDPRMVAAALPLAPDPHTDISYIFGAEPLKIMDDAMASLRARPAVEVASSAHTDSVAVTMSPSSSHAESLAHGKMGRDRQPSPETSPSKKGGSSCSMM